MRENYQEHNYCGLNVECRLRCVTTCSQLVMLFQRLWNLHKQGALLEKTSQ